MRVAFQMDPIEGVDFRADSTFRIAEEAQERGHELFVYTPDGLAFIEGRLIASGATLRVQRVKGAHATLTNHRREDLSGFDVVWLRQDPPFDMAYITNTHLLDRLPSTTLVANAPFWVRNLPEKLFVLDFPELTPPTAIARDFDTIHEFRERHGDVIIKPLYGNGGAGVFKLTSDDRNLRALHELFTGMSREPLIVQKFVPDVSAGDKRIILIDGAPVGAINRVPQPGETRSNMHVGGRAEAATLTPREREICAAIGPALREKGQIFVGIDVIGSYLTEINVTSPTGLQELERFDGVNITAKLWEGIEARQSR